MTGSSPLETEFEAINAHLDAAGETARQGYMPNLNGLDKRIAALCATLEKSESDIQQRCLPLLEALLKKLDSCESEIRASHAKRTDGNIQ
ncbi:MAG: hypothetical protein KGI97_03325 [Alphaproteobacteria bacterium]|nr:hypothetical protein [Alphaproteobacteria bacterium]